MCYLLNGEIRTKMNEAFSVKKSRIDEIHVMRNEVYVMRNEPRVFMFRSQGKSYEIRQDVKFFFALWRRSYTPAHKNLIIWDYDIWLLCLHLLSFFVNDPLCHSQDCVKIPTGERDYQVVFLCHRQTIPLT